MQRLLAWLVRHERLVVIIMLALVAALAVQQYFQRQERVEESPAPYVSSNNAPEEDSANVTTINVAGKWQMAVQKRKQGTINWTLILEQNGEELKGIIKSEGGDMPVKGTIKGRKVNFKAKRLGLTVEFPAVIEGEVMNGTMKALTVNRNWTARR